MASQNFKFFNWQPGKFVANSAARAERNIERAGGKFFKHHIASVSFLGGSGRRWA
jgi:hypothetical protein